MKDLIEYIAKQLVEAPDAVKVTDVQERGRVVIHLEVAEDDYGRVIGKGGRTANAPRTVVKAAAVKEQRRVLVDIVD